jgi:hypothetical protein
MANNEEIVEKAIQFLKNKVQFDRGCSGFICEVFEIEWINANSLLGNSPVYIGKNNEYSDVLPGDIVGWKKDRGHGHVSIYIGEPGIKFIDVQSENCCPRIVANGYGPTSLFKRYI